LPKKVTYVFSYLEGTTLFFSISGKMFTKEYNTVEGALHAQESLVKFGKDLGFNDVLRPK